MANKLAILVLLAGEITSQFLYDAEKNPARNDYYAFTSA